MKQYKTQLRRFQRELNRRRPPDGRTPVNMIEVWNGDELVEAIPLLFYELDADGRRIVREPNEDDMLLVEYGRRLVHGERSQPIPSSSASSP